MMTIKVNNRPVVAKPGDTVLDALRREGLNVPTLCYLKNLTPTGACRLCVVEVEDRRNLVPACSFPAAEGLKIKTHSPRVVRARRTIVELLLADHPHDCPYCARQGNCDLRDMAHQLGVRERRYAGERSHRQPDTSNPSLVRDPNKCVCCGKCVRVCREIQGVEAIDFISRGGKATVGTAFHQGLKVSSCINCGQCIMVCPTGALREQSHIKKVVAALNNPETTVVAQHAPGVSVTLGEAFGMKPGKDMAGKMTAALRRMGFDRVFDTAFAADLTIMELASELVHRLKNGGKLPMVTSCSPGWTEFVRQQYPDMIANLSTCKSPQQMMGAIIKTHFAEIDDLDPRDIFTVSITPCTAGKFEAARPEMGRDGNPDVDAVLTTREVARLIRMMGIDLMSLDEDASDAPLAERSSAGKLFGVTGGVMEATLRTAYYMVTGQELAEPTLKQLRGLSGSKQATIEIDGLKLSVAAVSGMKNAAAWLDEVRAGRSDVHFIEVMTCPGGCIAGGGQPLGADHDAIRVRMKKLYSIDRDAALRRSHRNKSVQRLYDEFLVEPLGERSCELLHTRHAGREVAR